MSCQLERLCIDANLKKKRLQDEDKKSALDLKTVLNFVESKNRTQSQAMKTAYKVAKDSGMNPVWITVDQALKLCKEIKNHVFIIESFKSDLFDKLYQSSYCQIYGPACIYYCKNGLYLPRRQYPILNLCMRNLVICADDQFDDAETVQMFGLINLMGGTFSLEFKPITTHLISNDYTTDKSRTARTYGIPIMNKEWIKECWEKSLNTELNADDKQIINKFRLPIFQGFCINISQIEEEVKVELQNLIAKNGGDNVEFRPKMVTHLILGEAKGPKYEVAKKFGIRIMTRGWIDESVKNGYPMLEYDYLYEPSSTQPPKFDFNIYDDILNSSTPYSQSIELARVQSSQICSTIHSQSLQISSQINSQINSQTPINRSQIITPQFESSQELSQKDRPKPQLPEPGKTYCVKSKSELAKSNNSDNTTKRTAFSVLTSSQSSNKQKTTINVEEELEKLTNQLNNCKSSIFDGCDFYIYDNFQQNIKVQLKRCITLQNGTISASLRQSVTHVIVKEESSEAERMKSKQELDKFDHTINQVTLKWIIQCSKSNKLVPLIQVNNLTESPTNKEQRSLSQQSIHQRSANQSQKRSKFPRHNSLHSQPVSQQLPIREVKPSRTDDIFNDYSDAVIIQPNLVESSQTNKIALDLDLMRREEKPLYKCVLTFSSYTVALNDELTKIAHHLGATCQSEFVKVDKPEKSKLKNTHLVCDEAKGKKYERALKWRVPVVNQYWLRKCQELVQRLNEEDFPPKIIDQQTTVCSKISKSDSQSSFDRLASSGSIVSSSASNGSDEDKQKLSSSQTVNAPIIERSSNNPDDTIVPSSSQTFQNKFDNLKTILNTKEQTTTLNKVPVTESNLNVNKNSNIKIDILKDDRSCFQNIATMPSIPIAWDDHRTNRQSIENISFSLPTNLPNQNKTINSTALNSTTLNQTTDSIIRPQLIKQVNEPFQVFEDSVVSGLPRPLCKFNFIGHSPQERQAFSKELEKLNIGVVMDGSLEYDYVITDSNKLVRNEGFFISMAKGKWILHLDFYHKTLELGKLPNPEEYEWGPASRYLATLDPKFTQMAKACKHWRTKVAQTGRRAFSGQNALIVSVNAKSFANIINKGGGNASAAELQIDNIENYTQVLGELYLKLKQGTIKGLDYILINYKKKERDRLNLLNLIRPIESLNICCMQIEYLSQFLVHDRNLNYKKLLINPSFSSSAINLKRALDTNDQPAVLAKMAKK